MWRIVHYGRVIAERSRLRDPAKISPSPKADGLVLPFFQFDTFRLKPYSATMPATFEALSHDALVLPPDQRVALAYRLLVSVEPDPEPDAAAAWDAEIAARIERFDRGESQPVPAADVFATLRAVAPDR